MCVGGGVGGGRGLFCVVVFNGIFFISEKTPNHFLAKQTKFWKNISIDNIFDANIFI